MSDHDNSSSVAVPFKGFIISLVITVSVLCGLGVQVWLSYRGAKSLNGQHIPALRLTGDMMRLDEVLTSSARLAAATGDPSWETAYRRFEPPRDEAVTELIGRFPQLPVEHPTSRTHIASQRLVEMEDQAFALVRQGKLQQASELLGSERYLKQKALYAGGVWDIVQIVSRKLTGQVKSQQRRTYWALAGIAAAVPLTLFSWTIVLQALRQHLCRRQKAEEELRINEERFTLAATGSSDGLWDWHGIGRADKVWWSSRYFELLGYQEGEIEPSQETFYSLLHPDDRNHVVSSIRAHLVDRQVYDTEYRLKAASGEYRWFRVRGQAVWDDSGDAVRMSGSSQDITSAKHNRQQLREHAARLEQLTDDLTKRNTELNEFTYVASHDLQEPLRKLISFSELLRQDLGDDLPPQAATDVRFIMEAAHRMRTLVHDLLMLSRAGRSEVRLQPVSLRACVQRALEALDVSIQETQALITIDDLPNIMGDPTLIQQIYQNLIGNAIKYCQRQPMIHITAAQTPGGWVLGVRDNGIGILEQYREQVFSPFKRLHGRSEYDGTGVGLAICRKAVERHDGRIWVESCLQSGSHFKFTLDAKRKAAA